MPAGSFTPFAASAKASSTTQGLTETHVEKMGKHLNYTEIIQNHDSADIRLP